MISIGIGLWVSGLTLAQRIAALFAAGEQGAWFDPSDLSTLFQDSAGTTPGAVGQPVGKMLDKSGRGNHATQATAAARPTLSARKNLLTYSEQFDNAIWAKDGVTVTANSIIAPDDTITADKVLETTSTTLHSVRYNATVTNDALTISAYISPIGRTYGALHIWDNASGTIGFWAIFNLSTGEVDSSGSLGGGAVTGATIEATESGLYRCTVSGTPGFAALSNFYISAPPTNTAISVGLTWTGDVAKGFHVWGAQLENRTTPSRYQRVTTATDYDTVGFPRKIDYDAIDDLLTASNPDLGTNVTIARATATGASILTGQTVGANYVDNTDHYGLILINRVLTAAETASVTAYLNMKAGL